jgi:intracellular septation protein A
MSNLLAASRPLAWDFLPTIAFAILTALHVDVRLATVVAVGVGVAQVLIVRALGRQVPLLQWVGLGLAVVFGALSMATNDPRFLMAKPTIIYLIVAAVMLKPGWMRRYMPAIVRDNGDDLIVAWGYAWAAMMALTGVANAVVAVWFSNDWPLFLAIVPLWSKVALFAAHFASLRLVIRRRLRAGAEAAALQGQPA